MTQKEIEYFNRPQKANPSAKPKEPLFSQNFDNHSLENP